MGFFFTFPLMKYPALKNVKLVVTDMDGTLLNTNHQVSEKFFKQFWALKEKGVTVVAASGRQHNSIVEKLAPIKEALSVIAENGAMTSVLGKETTYIPFPVAQLKKTLKILGKQRNMYPVLCTNGSAFIAQGQTNFEPILKEYYSHFNVVKTLEQYTETVLKIAIYHFKSASQYIYPAVIDLEKDLQIKVSGPNWVDLSHPNANKGYALKELQNTLGITPQETMVFGDYNNDLEMMQQAHFSFAMENAHPNVLQVANYKTASNNNAGVELVLEQLLKVL